ncbi:MAG TPA: hypothetical protein VFW19_07530 [Allosphingosinicella sp.]|nr:hypothetical protein [Allosphingosinicella sp.]
MPQPATFAIAAGLCAIGSAIGVTLGHATLDQINPADFQDPSFASDLSPGHTPADWAQVQAEEYRAAARQVLPEGCPNCAWPVAPVPPEDPAVARYDQPRTAAVPQEWVETPVRAIAIQEPPQPDLVQVERYAHYQVEQPVQQATNASPVVAQDIGGAKDIGGAQDKGGTKDRRGTSTQ